MIIIQIILLFVSVFGIGYCTASLRFNKKLRVQNARTGTLLERRSQNMLTLSEKNKENLQTLIQLAEQMGEIRGRLDVISALLDVVV